MFGTNKNAEIPLALLPPNVDQYWSYAHLDLHAPWFYIEYQFREGTATFRSMLLLSTVDQLIELSKRADLHLTQVKVVSPSHLNNSGSWQMDSLREIVRAKQLGTGINIPVTIYRLHDGREFQNGVTKMGNKLLDFEIVFSFQ